MQNNFDFVYGTESENAQIAVYETRCTMHFDHKVYEPLISINRSFGMWNWILSEECYWQLMKTKTLYPIKPYISPLVINTTIVLYRYYLLLNSRRNTEKRCPFRQSRCNMWCDILSRNAVMHAISAYDASNVRMVVKVCVWCVQLVQGKVYEFLYWKRPALDIRLQPLALGVLVDRIFFVPATHSAIVINNEILGDEFLSEKIRWNVSHHVVEFLE